MPERGPIPAVQYLIEMIPRWAPWMTVNLALGAIPVLLALVLFRPGRRTNPVWWAGFVVFVAFLPNAPYVLTNYRWLSGPWINAWRHDRWRYVTILPVWGLYFALGFAAFVVCVRLAQRFIADRWSEATGRVAVVLLVAGCAFGLYLGRADLFSWTVLTDPDEVVDVVAAVGRGAGLTGIVIAFVALLAGYVAVGAGIALVRRWRTAGEDRSATPGPQDGSGPTIARLADGT